MDQGAAIYYQSNLNHSGGADQDLVTLPKGTGNSDFLTTEIALKSFINKILRKFGVQVVRYQKSSPISRESGKWSVEYERVENGGAYFFVPKYAIHRPASSAILRGEYYEPKTHELIKLIGEREQGELIHAGTFFGDMLPSFSKAFSKGKVICFEPVLENYTLARLCVSENDLENVVLLNSALSEGTSNLKIETTDLDGVHRGGASRLAASGDLVPSISIDQFEFENLVCIQLDVEGHELKALNGARNSIAMHHPIILVEDNNKECDAFLLELDYEFVTEIPGLKIWTSKQRKSLLKGIL